MTNYHIIEKHEPGLFVNKDTDIRTLLLVRDCLTDVMSCLRLMGTWWLMTTVHHDHDITWPYDRDMTITTRILPTQHLWWSTKISWIHSSRDWESSSSWTSGQRCTGLAVVWNIYKWPGPDHFYGPGVCWVSCVDTERMGLSNRILSGSITTSALVPGSLQHCSNTHLDPADSILWGALERFIVTKEYWDYINLSWGFAFHFK